MRTQCYGINNICICSSLSLSLSRSCVSWIGWNNALYMTVYTMTLIFSYRARKEWNTRISIQCIIICLTLACFLSIRGNLPCERDTSFGGSSECGYPKILESGDLEIVQHTDVDATRVKIPFHIIVWLIFNVTQNDSSNVMTKHFFPPPCPYVFQ